MAVRSRDENNKCIWEIDNGDLEKLRECMNKWSFLDEQSMLRFAVSLLLKAEGGEVTIKINGEPQRIAPADELLKPKG